MDVEFCQLLSLYWNDYVIFSFILLTYYSRETHINMSFVTQMLFIRDVSVFTYRTNQQPQVFLQKSPGQ